MIAFSSASVSATSAPLAGRLISTPGTIMAAM
jgi:hypothetical protein